MKLQFSPLLLFSLVLVLASSCREKEEFKFELVNADTIPFHKPKMPIDSNDTLKMALGSKGAIWNTWDKLHKECLKNQFFRNPTYMGISNTVDLGSVYTKNGGILEWNFSQLFSDDDRKKVVSSGQPQPCDYSEQINVDFQALISSSLPVTGVEAELSNAIKNNNGISAKIDNWQIDKLVRGELNNLLESSTDEKVKQFKKDLVEKRLIMIAEVARINGFSATINLSKDISAALEAQLKEGIIRNLGNTDATIKYQYFSSRQIKVISQGSFIVFADFVKAKKMRQ